MPIFTEKRLGLSVEGEMSRLAEAYVLPVLRTTELVMTAKQSKKPAAKGTRRAADGERVAVILGDMFEDSEFRVPVDRLREAGKKVVIVGVDKSKTLHGKQGREAVKPDRSVDEVSVEDFDALLIPGGYSPDHIRTDPKMVSLTRDMFDAGKPVAAVCHAGSMLIEAEIVEERTVTSWPSIRTDLVNAGAHWVDREVAEDENLITSRNPSDLPAFTDALLRQLEHSPSHGSHA